jgi:hypothetical protein
MITQAIQAPIDQEREDTEYFQRHGRPRLEKPEETEARLHRNWLLYVKPFIEKFERDKTQGRLVIVK